MKRIAITICLILVLVGLVAFGLLNKNPASNDEYLRIHIRANSNSELDQSVKYAVRDAVVEAMVPILASCKSKQETEETLKKNFETLETVANKVLKENGFPYTCKARIACEEFPTRTYDGFTLEKGFYDALILDLGSGSGNNWWCVAYPPLCFLKSSASGQDAIYKSKLVEIVKSFKQK